MPISSSGLNFKSHLLAIDKTMLCGVQHLTSDNLEHKKSTDSPWHAFFSNF